jgi:hypothetical protein
MRPSGPVMKMPSSGPWFALGAKIVGQKETAEKPTAPVTSAPIIVDLTNPAPADVLWSQTYRATAMAATNETTTEMKCGAPAEASAAPTVQYTKYRAATALSDATTPPTSFCIASISDTVSAE